MTFPTVSQIWFKAVRLMTLSCVLAVGLFAISIVLPAEGVHAVEAASKSRASTSATQKAFKREATACKSLGRDMRMAANADVTKSEAMAYANAAQVAFREDKRNTEAKQFARDANAFVDDFSKHSPFKSVSLAVVKDCATRNVGAPLFPAAVTTTTTSPSSSSVTVVAGVTSLVEQSLSVPANGITVHADNDEPTWAFWTVNDPNNGAAAGFANLIGGSWQIAAGPGSADVGFAPGPTVPPQVMTYFGQTCRTGNTGNTGNTGTGTTGNTGASSPPTISVQGAYQEGYQWGKQIQSNGQGLAEFMASAACKRTFADDPAATSAYYSGCMAGAGY